MTDLHIVPPVAAQPMTTDIFLELMVQREGFRKAFTLIYPVREGEPALANLNATFLTDVETATDLSFEAARLIRERGVEGASWTTVPDAGGASWCLGLAEGPRAFMTDLLAAATAMGFAPAMVHDA